jgi:hypothetical protein
MAKDGANSAAVTKTDYLSLATFVAGKDNSRLLSKDRHSENLRAAAQQFENRDYVGAYECAKPVYDKVVANMQRVLARNVDFEANKLAKELRKPVAVAKQNVLSMRAHAQQVIDQFDRIMKDLEGRALVRHHLKKGRPAVAQIDEESPLPQPLPAEGRGANHGVSLAEGRGANEGSLDAEPTTLNSTSETHIDVTPVVDSPVAEPATVPAAERLRYRKVPYAVPEKGTVYEVRDQSGKDRVVRVISKSPDGALLQVEKLKDGVPSNRPFEVAVESLARLAAKGLCRVLVPVGESEQEVTADPSAEADSPEEKPPTDALMRIDIQNFGRCCADIVRADLKFSTQLIKDVGDGPFRAGKYEQAFLTFEQLAIGFNSAVTASRREIADGRRQLTAEKGNLSGKEIQERTAAFIRSEQLIHTAEREFSTILEGLRMYLRAEQG